MKRLSELYYDLTWNEYMKTYFDIGIMIVVAIAFYVNFDALKCEIYNEFYTICNIILAPIMLIMYYGPRIAIKITENKIDNILFFSTETSDL